MPTRSLSSGSSLDRAAGGGTDEFWQAKKLAELHETAAAQAALRPLAAAAEVAVGKFSSQAAELAAELAKLEAARLALARRVERWDADELAPKWAATASWLHPKDKSTAQLLERRKMIRSRAEQLLKATPPIERQLPERLAGLGNLQRRCEEVRNALVPPSVLMAEEMVLADKLAELNLSAARATSVTVCSSTVLSEVPMTPIADAAREGVSAGCSSGGSGERSRASPPPILPSAPLAPNTTAKSIPVIRHAYTNESSSEIPESGMLSDSDTDSDVLEIYDPLPL